jgi:hypothetical protein
MPPPLFNPSTRNSTVVIPSSSGPQPANTKLIWSEIEHTMTTVHAEPCHLSLPSKQQS